MEAGPRLPIEFARVGDHHELATVLCPGAARVPTRWAELTTGDLAEAREQLRLREEIPADSPHHVGSIEGLQTGRRHLISPLGAFCGSEIAAWGEAMGLSAVIWTALPPRYASEEGRAPSTDEAVGYLHGLTGEALGHARDYVRRVPPEIRTSYRLQIEDRLGWRPVAP